MNMTIIEHIMQCQCDTCRRRFCRPLVYAAKYPPLHHKSPSAIIRHGEYGWICHNYRGPVEFYAEQADEGQMEMFE